MKPLLAYTNIRVIPGWVAYLIVLELCVICTAFWNLVIVRIFG
jgi:hypothetical protein